MFFPDGYIDELYGALSLLAEVDNWEAIGTATSDEVASAFLAAFLKSVKGGNCMPTGAILAYAGDTAPDGYLECDGASYEQADYPNLYDVIGQSFGGTGTVFNVPALQDKVVAGAGATYNQGDTGGASRVTLSESEMPNHNHSIPGQTTTLSDIPVGAVPVLSPFTGGNTGNTGGGNSHENMPPYMALMFIIKT